MPRWEPDTEQRLQHAAVELFLEQGYAATTVPEIAERAGVARRTFFRYFPDKREVLFAGEDEIPERVRAMVAEAPADSGPMDLIEHGFARVAEQLFEGRRAELRVRCAIIDANPELAERDLHKLDVLHRVLVDALRGRGADPLDAEAAATIAVTVFRSALRRWIATDDDRTFTDVATEALRRVRALAA
jgi:AcrR family transcriptional regulator